MLALDCCNGYGAKQANADIALLSLGDKTIRERISETTKLYVLLAWGGLKGKKRACCGLCFEELTP